MATVLVVDDDDDIRELIAIGVQRAGHDVTSVADPVAALAVATESSFDMAVLDWSMPNMNGGELCARLRNLPHFASRPVLILTAYADRETRTKALAAGATAFMTKPFSLRDLGDAVERALPARTG
ncbi:CheY-like chemotaxis protein [Nocardioides sp. BE266]|uniref:response regulator n=1 Tax=Nocardioides sp. BE266 TaxID=2817725 RepID=UPI0028555382|nr:response regulator [Nocardioides sp. BE266]MDR7252202.1 CheY-like chemotaxis protein [Nocardioides sp. BE266]